MKRKEVPTARSLFRSHWLGTAKHHFESVQTNNATCGMRYIGVMRVKKCVKVPRRNQIGGIRTPLIRGNRRKCLRDFKNLRAQVRFVVPAALDQRPQIVRARTMCRPGRSVAPEHRLHYRPIRLLATERSLTGKYLWWCSNS